MIKSRHKHSAKEREKQERSGRNDEYRIGGRRKDVYCIVFTAALLLVVLFIQVFIVHPELGDSDVIYPYLSEDYEGPLDQHPLLVDWHNHHGFTGTRLRTCKMSGRPEYTCFMSTNKTLVTTNLSQAILFYGTDMDLYELPLPRKPAHIWSLMHEESPKNNILFSFKGIMEMFNYTSTFRRESNFPLTTQYLRNVEQLESTKFMKSFEEKEKFMKEENLAPIIYVQTDCDVPSDRDNVVKLLMKYVKVDSYGLCLHNRDLPKHLADPMEGMTHDDFLELISKYKFAVAMENGVCTDYITEKFWRPLHLGTIPIVLGSPSVEDFAPTNRSILDVTKYASIKELTTDIERISSSQKEYESYRAFKWPGGVTNDFLKKTLASREWEPDTDVQLNLDRRVKPNYPSLYACKVCEMMHKIQKGKTYRATINHYGCEWPMEFTDENDLKKKRPFSDLWYSVWQQTSRKVEAFVELSKGGRQPISAAEMTKRFHQLLGASMRARN